MTASTVAYQAHSNSDAAAAVIYFFSFNYF